MAACIRHLPWGHVGLVLESLKGWRHGPEMGHGHSPHAEGGLVNLESMVPPVREGGLRVGPQDRAQA